MFALQPLLRRSTGAFALVLAFAVLLSSVCPRGWFLCVHGDALVLVDGYHADGYQAKGSSQCSQHEDACLVDCAEVDSCADEIHCADDVGCPSGCPAEEGCLDLAISLVFDDQNNAAPVLATLPSGHLIAHLPDLTAAAALRTISPPREPPGNLLPSPFVVHIRLQV